MNVSGSAQVERANLEVVRAALCSLAADSALQARPVHITRISTFFRRYFPDDSCTEALALLRLLREAESLFGGYWYPVPPRGISMGKFTLLICPHTTEELTRSLGGRVSFAGLGRIVDVPVVPSLPYQELREWMGAPRDLMEWFAQYLSKAAESLSETLRDGPTVRVYSPWDSNSTSLSKSHVRWLPLGPNLNAPSTHPVLCREAGQNGQELFFFAEVKQGKIVRESSMSIDDVPDDVPRLQLAMDKSAGALNYYFIKREQEEVILQVRRRLPYSEYRLLRALGLRRELQPGRYDYVFKNDYFPVMDDTLHQLGFRNKDK